MAKIDLREVVDFINTLAPDADVVELVTARYPSLTRAEMQQVAALLRAQEEAAAAERAALERLLAIARCGNPPDGERIGMTLRRLADAGDTEAAAALAEMDSPERRAWNAVFRAAVDRHPDWRPSPDSSTRVKGPKAKDHPERDPKRLVAWFERLYPAEAARITAEALAA